MEVHSHIGTWQPPPEDPADPMGMWPALPGSPFSGRPKQDWFVVDPFTVQADVSHFMDCLEHGCDSAMTVEIAAAATEVLTAAYQSAAAISNRS